MYTFYKTDTSERSWEIKALEGTKYEYNGYVMEYSLKIYRTCVHINQEKKKQYVANAPQLDSTKSISKAEFKLINRKQNTVHF